jgi:hypothetical protein
MEMTEPKDLMPQEAGLVFAAEPGPEPERNLK